MKISLSVLLLSSILIITGCAQQPIGENQDLSSQKDPQSASGLLNQSIPAPKQDFFDAIDAFADRFPTYGGYSVSSDGQRLIIYTTDQRSDNSHKMHDMLMDVMEKSSGTPEVSDGQGKSISLRGLPFTYERVQYPWRQLTEWRKQMRSLLYTGSANKLSITDLTNKINIQIPDEGKRSSLLDFLHNYRIPVAVVNVTVGVNIAGKTLYDTFTPPVGGVNIQNVDNLERCTLGLPVLVDNVPSYLTASHCSTTWGTADGGAITQNAVKIGTESFDALLYSCPAPNVYSQCQDADTTIYSAIGGFTRGRIIKTTGGTGSRDTGTTDTYYDVTTISERPAAQQVVSSIGATSGYRDATVISSDTDVVYSSDNKVIKHAVEVQRSSTTGVAAGCQGDSGGPWFQVTGTNTAKFLGIYTGQTGDATSITRPDGRVASCGYTAYFSPTAQIRIAFPNKTFTFTR